MNYVDVDLVNIIGVNVVVLKNSKEVSIKINSL